MLLSLAYEGLPSDDLRIVGGALADVGVRATFFVNPPNVLEDLPAWQALADAGHEIANAALSGVSLSGELINWTLRMVEQDLHMTQSFLEDVFPDRAVPVFAYPGPFTRCSDGDYRLIVESLFELAVTPGPLEQRLSPREIPRIALKEWTGAEDWAVVRGPRPLTPDFAELRQRLTSHRVPILPVFEAARRVGRVAAQP